VGSAAFSPDGRLVLTAEGDVALLWDARDGRLLRTLRGHSEGVAGVRFGPGRTFALSTSVDHTVRLPDGKVVGTVEKDGTTRLWELPSGRALVVLGPVGGSAEALAFGLGGRAVVTDGDFGLSASSTLTLYRCDLCGLGLPGLAARAQAELAGR
jgi:WD40 repeat protein